MEVGGWVAVAMVCQHGTERVLYLARATLDLDASEGISLHVRRELACDPAHVGMCFA